MPTSTTRTKRPRFGTLVGEFVEWLGVRDQKDVLAAQQEKLRLKLLAEIADSGRVDDAGHIWYEFDEPVEFKATTKDGKKVTKVFSGVKNQLSLVPAIPQPDPEKAEELLRKKKLWLTPEQERAITRLRSTLPLFDITVELNTDRFGDLVFTKEISDKEYQRTLEEQTEKISFVPVEEK